MDPSLVPIMTADNAPSGVCSARSVSYGMSAYRAVGGDPSQYWHSGDWGSAAFWWKYQFTTPKIVTGYSLGPRPDDNSWQPRAWILQGSNDGSSWTTLDTQTSITWTWPDTTPKFWTVANTTSFLYYQLNNLYSTGNSYVCISKLKLYGLDAVSEPPITLSLGRRGARVRALVGAGGRRQ